MLKVYLWLAGLVAVVSLTFVLDRPLAVSHNTSSQESYDSGMVEAASTTSEQDSNFVQSTTPVSVHASANVRAKSSDALPETAPVSSDVQVVPNTSQFSVSAPQDDDDDNELGDEHEVEDD